MRSYYDELGVEQTATQEQILEAYRYLALRFHPDLNKGKEAEAERRFVRIQLAFDTLSDTKRRLRYDCNLLSSLRKVIVATEPEHLTTTPPPSPAASSAVEPLDLDFRVKPRQKRLKKRSTTLAVLFFWACVFASGLIIYSAVQHMQSNGIHRPTPGEK